MNHTVDVLYRKHTLSQRLLVEASLRMFKTCVYKDKIYLQNSSLYHYDIKKCIDVLKIVNLLRLKNAHKERQKNADASLCRALKEENKNKQCEVYNIFDCLFNKL